jgi:hypothetical protein
MKIFLVVFAVIFLLASPSYGAIVGGIETNSVLGTNEVQQETGQRNIIQVAPGMDVVNFDDIAASCLSSESTALTDQYSSSWITFSGPGGNDGGAILDECSNFGVSGHSSPNFLGFNNGASLSDGGVPQGPETITFDLLASHVQINAGSGYNLGETATMECFNSLDNLVGSDSITITSALQTLSVDGCDITRCVISYTGTTLVLDDLAFEACHEYDLDCDGDVDIVDVMKVAAKWSWKK